MPDHDDLERCPNCGKMKDFIGECWMCGRFGCYDCMGYLDWKCLACRREEERYDAALEPDQA